MTKEYWTITEVVEIIEIDENVITNLEEEEVICPKCFEDRPTKYFSAVDMDKLRLAKILMDDMDVNLPGVEIILRMRESMLHMRRQFDDILEDLALQIRKTLEEKT